MADEPDPALTGAAFELANAGFRPMSDPEKKDEEEAIGSDTTSLREAAEQRSRPSDEIVVREYIDKNDKPVAADEAISLDRAVRDYSSATAADRLVAENTTSKELAARVDAMRAEALAEDPEAAEFYGFALPQAEAAGYENPEAEKVKADPTKKAGDDTAAELDPDLEKVLQHPQVRQALDQKVGEAEKTRQDYVNGLVAATQIAQVSFLSQFPEFAGISAEDWPATLEQMSRQDPQRFARVQDMIANTEQLIAQQQQESRRQTEVTRQNFLEFAKSEDARLDTMLKGEPKAIQHAVTAEIFASAKASGIEPAELHRLFNSEPLMRNAVFQRMMYDAGKYRLMMKAKDTVATKPVPPVKRPGLARTPAEREHADLRTLNARLSSSGNIKDAVALYNARKSNKR